MRCWSLQVTDKADIVFLAYAPMHAMMYLLLLTPLTTIYVQQLFLQ